MGAGFSEGDALRFVADLVEVLGEPSDVTATARRILEVISRSVGVELLAIYVRRPDGALVRVLGPALGAEVDALIPPEAPLLERLGASPGPLRIPVGEHFSAAAAEALAKEGVRACVAVPLRLGERFTGAMVASRRDGALAQVPDEIFAAFGRVAGVALEQARLHAASRTRAERDRLLLEAARFAGMSSDLDAALARYVEVLRVTASATRASIALFDPDQQTLRLRVSADVDAGSDAAVLALPVHRVGNVAKALETRRLQCYRVDEITNVVVREFFEKRQEIYFAALPLFAHEAATGIAFVSRTEPFDPDVLVLLEAVAHEIAATVASAAERESSRRTAEREELEARLRKTLRDSFDLPQILQGAVESLGKLLHADRSSILVPDKTNAGWIRVVQAWRRDASWPDSVGMSFPTDATFSGDSTEAQVVYDIGQDQRYKDRERDPRVPPSFVWVKLAGAAERGGIAVAMNHPRRWTPDEVRIVQAVAEHCQIAIARAELYEDARRHADELELTVAHMADGVVMVNEKLEIVRMNPAARQLLWRRPDAPPPGQVDGWNPHIVVLDAERRLVPSERWPIVRSVVHGEVVRDLEVVFQFKDDGREKQLVVNSSPLKDPDGRLRGGVIVLRDVTDARAAASAAQRTEKLRVVGELAASVAHELNNTLAAVLGRAEMIAASTKVAETRNDAEVIAHASRDASVVLARLTRLSQKSHGQAPRTRVDLARIAEDAIELTRPRWQVDASRAGKDVQVEIDAPEPVIVRGIAPELREVFTNLILNSVDALAKRGTIRVAAGRDAAGGAFFEVKDDGAGMPDEVLRHAFEPFFTTKGEEGTGLGLSISAAIVAGHGGKIDARSAPGKGTVIRATLPLAEDDPTPAHPQRIGAPRRVLVVDDDARVRGVLADILAAEGHAIATASSGEEALALLERTQAPDLVVTDVAMPGMSGWALAEETRLRFPEVAIILVSGWSGSATRDALEALRATFVLKPFRSEEFKAAVREAFALAGRAPAQ